MFREEVGVTPDPYITRKRLQCARRLLENTGLPLIEVSVQSGFSSQSAFAPVFKKHHTITPRQHRLK